MTTPSATRRADVPRLEYRFTLHGREWTLDLLDLEIDEVIQIRALTGYSWVELTGEFDRRDALALKAIFWYARRKAGDNIEFDSPEMNFRMRDFRCTKVRDDDVSAPAAEGTAAAEGSPDPTDAGSRTTSNGTSPSS